MDNKTIMWFRQDLRILDNPAFSSACKAGIVLPIYIFDNINPKNNIMGAASKVWLHYSLIDLQKNIKDLSIFIGDPKIIIPKLCNKHKIDLVVWNKCYELWQINRDQTIKNDLSSKAIKVKEFDGSVLWKPQNILKFDGNPYKIFTPFYKECLQHKPPRQPITRPRQTNTIADNESLLVQKLNLLPKNNWGNNIIKNYDVGEQAAIKKLNKFIENKLANYTEIKNFPSYNGTSGLSPHIHFGEISPNRIWHDVKIIKNNEGTNTLLKQLVWRDFAYNLLYHNPEIRTKNIKSKFDNFPWKTTNNNFLDAWEKGETGVPFIDAGMRELWQTGYMHNRLRMLTGSFLVKNLLIHWNEGEKWFWDCLLDADHANNAASWQWVAGCGTDAAPYFRIFNPITQGQTYDPDGEYTLKYVPELKNLDKKYLFRPWEAPNHVLEAADLKLGTDYPIRIVDISESRKQSLDLYSTL